VRPAGRRIIERIDVTSDKSEVEAEVAGDRRILLFEDDAPLANTICHFLGVEFRVDAAEDLVEAQTLVMRTQYDAVICDLFIVEADSPSSVGGSRDGGITLISSLRNQLVGFPAWGRTVPIVAITGARPFNWFDPLQGAANVGATVVLRKPFTDVELIDAVASAIQRGAGIY